MSNLVESTEMFLRKHIEGLRQSQQPLEKSPYKQQGRKKEDIMSGNRNRNRNKNVDGEPKKWEMTDTSSLNTIEQELSLPVPVLYPVAISLSGGS